MKREDPYAQLGLSWNDGSTLSEIKSAYFRRAAQLHPDVNPSPKAREEFQRVQRAYDILVKQHSRDDSSNEAQDAWRFRVWRAGDRLAIERTDVAGSSKQRPVPPAKATQQFAGVQLGHPDGSGARRSGEFIGSGNGDKINKTSSSVGRGRSKWVQPKEFVPWNGSVGNNANQTNKTYADKKKQSDSL
jgi:curved DNA-binding protein CbpA